MNCHMRHVFFVGKGKEISASVLVILREHECQPVEERRG